MTRPTDGSAPGSAWRAAAPCLGLICTILVGCASGPRAREVTPARAIKEAQASCKVLIDSRLKAPVSTDIGPMMAKAQAAKKGGKAVEAVAVAQDLKARCTEETRQREELAQVAQEVHSLRHLLPPRLYNRFMALTVRGAYTEAIYCGDGLVSDRPDRCRDQAQPVPRASRRGSVTLVDPTLEEAVKGRKEFKRPLPVKRKDSASELDQVVADAHRVAQAEQDAERGEEVPDDLSPEEAEGQKGGRLWTWVALGSAGAMLVTGGVLGGLAQKQYNDLDSSCPNCTQAEIDRGKDMALASDALVGIGVVAAAAGAVLFFFEKQWFGQGAADEKRAGVRVDLSPAGISLRGRF